MIAFLVHNLWWVAGLALIAAAVFVPAAAWKLRCPIAILIAAVFAVVLWMDASDMRLQLSQRDAADSQALATALADVRTAEQTTATALAANATAYQQGQTDAEAVFDRVRADLDRGTVRVQKRLQCAPAAAGVPGATATAIGSDAGAPTGFTDQDAVAALGIARDGDDGLRALKLCQDTVRAYFALAGAQP